jgi:hypothetical protein
MVDNPLKAPPRVRARECATKAPPTSAIVRRRTRGDDPRISRTGPGRARRPNPVKVGDVDGDVGAGVAVANLVAACRTTFGRTDTKT